MAEPDHRSFREDPFGAMNDWLQTVEGVMPDGMKLLLGMDEYETLSAAVKEEWGGKLLDYLRHLQQYHSRVVLLFVGSKTFAKLGRDWTARFVAVRHMRVGFLMKDECRPLLERPVDNFTMRYVAGALDALLDLTTGQPYLTQAVAYELVHALNFEGRKEASVADVRNAGLAALESGAGYFENVWDDAERDGREMLARVVRGEVAVNGESRSHLHEMDLLTDEGEFAVPLVEQWVRRKVQESSS